MAFLLRRLVFYLAAFIAAATINFFLPRLMPGDPIQKMFAGAGSDLSLENLNALKLTFGFIDAPIGEQYLAYLKSVFTGDLGRSIKYFPLPVTDLLGRALLWTVGLVGTAKIIGFTKGETEYQVALLPLGGYVKMAGDLPHEELPPEEAAANVAYLRQMLAHRGSAATPDHGAHTKTGAT